MEDASLLASLPDDVEELKRLLIAREEQHRASLAGHGTILTKQRNTIATQQSKIIEHADTIATQQGKIIEHADTIATQQSKIIEHADTIASQQSTIATLTKQRDEYYVEKLRLEIRLAKVLKRAYGPRADRVRDLGQLLLGFAAQIDALPISEDLPDDAAGDDEAAAQPSPSRRLRTRGRRDIGELDHLPLIEQVYELTDELCRCPSCQAEREQIGSAVSYTVEYIPGSLVRIKHVQHKYACRRCEQNGYNPNITLAPKRKGSPIDKGMPGPGLLAYVATAKFGDYMPLYRLENFFAREGFELDRSTMCVWMADVARLVGPLYDRMVQRVRQSHVLATDDTVMPMQHPGKTKKSRMWIYQGDESCPYNVFEFTVSHSRDGPTAFLKDFHNTLLADAYGGYDGIVLTQELPRAGCWAHARRKFIDCQAAAPEVTQAILRLIKRLFALEAKLKKVDADERLRRRQAEAAPLMESLHALLLEQKGKLLPKHPLAEAIGYALNQWSALTLFLTDPAVPIHNNLAEQEMKRIALLRKNALFVATPNGGRTAAILSSLTSTCRRHGVNPQAYLTQLLANLPDTPVNDLDQWLPDEWKKRRDGQPMESNPRPT